MARINAGRRLRALLEGYHHQLQQQQQEQVQEQEEEEEGEDQEQVQLQQQEDLPASQDAAVELPAEDSTTSSVSVKAPPLSAAGSSNDAAGLGAPISNAVDGSVVVADDDANAPASVEVKQSTAPAEGTAASSGGGEAAAMPEADDSAVGASKAVANLNAPSNNAAEGMIEPGTKMPEVSHDNDNDGLTEGPDCSLCYDPVAVSPGTASNSSFKCGHLFHAECADAIRKRGPPKMLSSSSTHNCPMCGSEPLRDEATLGPIPSTEGSDGSSGSGSSSSDSHNNSNDSSEVAPVVNVGPTDTVSGGEVAGRAAGDPDDGLVAQALAPTNAAASASANDGSVDGANDSHEHANQMDEEAAGFVGAEAAADAAAPPAVEPAAPPDIAPADRGGNGNGAGNGDEDDAQALNNINVVVDDAAAAAAAGGGGGDGWDDEPINVDLPDAMGFGQPLGGAFVRAAKLLAFNAVFLVFFQLVPYQLGALLLGSFTSETQGPGGGSAEHAGGKHGDLTSNVLGPVFGRAFISVFGSMGEGEPPSPVHAKHTTGNDDVPTLPAMVCGHCALLVLAITTAAVCFVLAAVQLVQARVPGGLFEANRLMVRTLIAAARARWVRAQVHALVNRAQTPLRRRLPAHGRIRRAAAGGGAGGGAEAEAGAGARAGAGGGAEGGGNGGVEGDANQNAVARLDAALAAARLGQQQHAVAPPPPPGEVPRGAAIRIVFPLDDAEPELLEAAAMALMHRRVAPVDDFREVAAAVEAGAGVTEGDLSVVAAAVTAGHDRTDDEESNVGDEAMASETGATELPTPVARDEIGKEAPPVPMEPGSGILNVPGETDTITASTIEAQDETMPRSEASSSAALSAVGTAATEDDPAPAAAAAAVAADSEAGEVQAECFDAATAESTRDDQALWRDGMAPELGSGAHADVEKVEIVEERDTARTTTQSTANGEEVVGCVAVSTPDGSGLDTGVNGRILPERPRDEEATTATAANASKQQHAPPANSSDEGGVDAEAGSTGAENTVADNAEADEDAAPRVVDGEHEDHEEENEEEADRRPAQLPMLPFLFPPQLRVQPPRRERRRRRRDWAWRDVAVGIGRGVRAGFLLWGRALLWSWRVTCMGARTLLGLAIELVVLPVGVGWLIDAATLPAVGGDWGGRIAFAASHLTAATTLHWVAGLGALMAASVVIKEVCAVKLQKYYACCF